MEQIDRCEYVRDAIGDACRQNLAGLRRSAADAWRPKARIDTAEWADGHVRLDDQVEAGGGPFDLTGRPWWREILQQFDEPDVRRVVVVAATQLGKTLTLIASILAAARTSPGPGMAVLPDRDAAVEFRDRVYADALQSPELRELVPREHLWNTRWIDLKTMRVYLAWSGSRQRMRGRACKRVWESEVDVYQTGDKKAGNPIAAAEQRTKAFWRSIQYLESSPSEDPSEVCELERAATDRRRWYVECPHCGKWQELRFFLHDAGKHKGRGGLGGLKDGDGNWLSIEDSRKAAHYICLAGCRIEQAHKQAMLEGGRWLSMGQRIDKSGRVRGKRPDSRRTIGYHLWSIFSGNITFGDLAAAYMEARTTGKLKEFFGNWLGLAFKPKTKIPTWQQLARKLAGPNSLCKIPADVWFLTAGADVQEDEVLYAVRGWAPERTSYQIDAGALPRRDGDETDLVKSDLLQLNEAVLSRRWSIDGGTENPLGRKSLTCRLLNVDSNYRTLDVHNWIRSLPETWTKGQWERVRAIRGDHQADPSVPYRLSLLEANVRTGKKYEGGLRQWGIYVYLYWADLYERLAGRPGQPGSWYVADDAVAHCRDYLQQVVNFHRVVELDNGRQKVVWRAKNTNVPVDFWDCETYASVAADMVVGTLGWSIGAWELWKQTSQGKRRGGQSSGETIGLR